MGSFSDHKEAETYLYHVHFNDILDSEELTAEKISNTHARSVLLGFIDDDTRLHTVEYHGTDKSLEEFKNAVVRFTNSAELGSGAAPGTGPAPMQIGSMHAPGLAQSSAGAE